MVAAILPPLLDKLAAPQGKFSLTSAHFTWASIIILLAALLLGFIAVFCWMLFFRNKRKRKRKHRGHGRIKPTLAEVGGLPPVRRQEDQRSNETFDP